jgi:trimethylamine--corrinoid protein Co-methyltransferase
VIFGAFVTSIDMNSGAPTFGTPEAQQITYGAGQLARRLGLPYRSAGRSTAPSCPMRRPPTKRQFAQMRLLSGVNFMLHACGWLEGGLVSSPEKFVMDADQLGHPAQVRARRAIDENAQAMDALREVGPGGHFLGCAHTQANYQGCVLAHRACSITSPSRPGPKMAASTARSWPPPGAEAAGDYQAPMLDPAIDEALRTTSPERKAEMPDAFI